MHSQSLRNSYEESGVLVLSSNHPAAHPDSYGQEGRRRGKPSTTRIPRSSSGGKLRFVAALVVLIVMGGGGLYGYTFLQSVQSEARDAKKELKAVKAQVAAAEKKATEAEAQVAFSQEKISEGEANLALATEAAEEKEKAASELESKLQSLLEDGQGQVVKGKDGRLTLQLVDKVLFRSGEAELTKRGQRVMGRVGKALKEMEDKQVWVQGHTDDVPVSEDNKNFSSNWELSAARALTVVHYLQEQSQVDPKRLAAAAFGSHRPVSRRTKAKNRRIEIVLFPTDVKLTR